MKIIKVLCAEYLTGYITDTGKLFINKWSAGYTAVECKDTGLSNIVDGIGGQYDILVKDSAGNVTVVSVDSNTLKVVKNAAPVTNASVVFNLFGAYFCITTGGIFYTWGIDRLSVGAAPNKVVKLKIPSGKTIVKLTGGSSTRLSDFTIYGLASDGTVWKWNGLTPSQVTFAGNVAVNITTVGCYAVVIETPTDLLGYGYNPSVIGLPWNQNKPISIKQQWVNAGAVFPTKQLIGNYNSLHIIDANGNHYAQGNQVMGEVGFGATKNYLSSDKSYQWNWLEMMYQSVVQIAGKWKELFSSPSVAFYWYGINENDNLFSWGRNKAMVLGNGVTLPAFDAAGKGYDTRPNAMDVPTPSYVEPLTTKWEVLRNFDVNNPPTVTVRKEPPLLPTDPKIFGNITVSGISGDLELYEDGTYSGMRLNISISIGDSKFSITSDGRWIKA